MTLGWVTPRYHFGCNQLAITVALLGVGYTNLISYYLGFLGMSRNTLSAATTGLRPAIFRASRPTLTPMITTYRSRRSKRHRIEESWRGGGSLAGVIDELVSPLRLREAVELIEAHSGIRVDQSTVYRWVRAEREQALK